MAQLILVRRMNTLTLLALFALAELGCSSDTSLVHQSYWIELPTSHTKRDCMRVEKEVRRYALAAGYHSEDWQVTGRGERLALFETDRDHLTIDFLRRGGTCHINVTSGGYSARPAAIAERKRLYADLITHGTQAREGHDGEMVEIIDYGR